MATYVPNAADATEPVESQTVESAALEFRTLKTKVIADKSDIDADIQTLTADLAAESIIRADVDTVLTDKVMELDYAISALGGQASNYTNVWYIIVGTTPGTSENQTLFIGLDLDADNVEVFYNGILLMPEIDYTHTTTSLLLADPVQLNDTLTIYTYRQVVTTIDCGAY
jgi:hypothetical protein